MRILYFFLFFNICAVQAQDLHSSQPHRTPLAMNPALTGVMSGNFRLTANVRRQWASVVGSKAWEQSHFSFDFRKCLDDGSFLAFGVMAQGDRAGSPSFSNVTAALSFAYHGKMSDELYFSAGAAAGALRYGLDPSGMTFDEQFDESGYNSSLPNFENFERSSRIVPDLSAGVLLFSPHSKEGDGWLLGAAVQHVNQPSYSFFDKDANRLGIGFSLHGSATFVLSGGAGSRSKVTLRGLYRRQAIFKNSRQWQAMPGATWRYGIGKSRQPRLETGMGLSARLGGHAEGKAATLDALVPTLFFQFDRWSLGMSYDINTSSLKRASSLRGGWELSFAWEFQEKVDCIVCPNY